MFKRSTDKLCSILKQKFPNAPSSYLISFLILHEITAIIPIPIIFYTLKATKIDPLSYIPPEITEAVNSKAERISKYLSSSNDTVLIDNANGNLSDGFSSDLSRLVCTLAIVRILFPLRIGISLNFTPKLSNMFTKLRNRFK